MLKKYYLYHFIIFIIIIYVAIQYISYAEDNNIEDNSITTNSDTTNTLDTLGSSDGTNDSSDTNTSTSEEIKAPPTMYEIVMSAIDANNIDYEIILKRIDDKYVLQRVYLRKKSDTNVYMLYRKEISILDSNDKVVSTDIMYQLEKVDTDNDTMEINPEQFDRLIDNLMSVRYKNDEGKYIDAYTYYLNTYGDSLRNYWIKTGKKLAPVPGIPLEKSTSEIRKATDDLESDDFDNDESPVTDSIPSRMNNPKIEIKNISEAISKWAFQVEGFEFPVKDMKDKDKILKTFNDWSPISIKLDGNTGNLFYNLYRAKNSGQFIERTYKAIIKEKTHLPSSAPKYWQDDSGVRRWMVFRAKQVANYYANTNRDTISFVNDEVSLQSDRIGNF